MNKVIAVIGITNVASMNIYDISDEEVLAGINNEKPRKYKLYVNTKGYYFNFRGRRFYLEEAMRVN